MIDAFTRLKVSYIYSQKKKYCAPQENISLQESAVRQGEDQVKKLLLRWQGQPHCTQLELHLCNYHLQQLLREEYGKGQAFSKTSPGHSSSLSANRGSGTFCVRADIFAFKKMDMVLQAKKGNPLFKTSFIVWQVWNCCALESLLTEVLIYEPKFLLIQSSFYK